jgi:Protein of unknown function (DUF3309)
MNLYSTHLREMILVLVAIVIVVSGALSHLPLWPSDKKRGFDPTASFSFLLVSVLILLFLGVL